MNKLRGIAQSIKVISLAVILSFGVSLVYAWTAPTDVPPNGNSTAPLNTSTGIQIKEGTLVFNRGDGVQGLETYGKTLFATNNFDPYSLVGIGTPSPWAKLTVENTNDPNLVPDIAVGNPDFASSRIALTNGLLSAEATISTEGTSPTGGDTDFRIKTRSDGGFDPTEAGILTDRFVVDWSGAVGINTSSPTEALTVGGVIETKAGPGGASGIKFNNGSIQTAAVPFGNLSVFSANGTFVVPANVTRVWVEVYGGGGSGTAGDAGGAGGVAMGYLNVTPGQSIPVTVGAGGIATYDGSFGCYLGTNGGTSSFSTISATGGSKGKGSCSGSGVTSYGGGLGGVGSGGSINQRGGAGASGAGGSNNRSGGGTTGTGAQANGSSFGGGGGPAGNGGAGGVIVWY